MSVETGKKYCAYFLYLRSKKTTQTYLHWSTFKRWIKLVISLLNITRNKAYTEALLLFENESFLIHTAEAENALTKQ